VRASRVLGPVGRLARDGGVGFAGEHRAGNNPWRVIIETAREHGCDLIFMASHGRRGIDALLIGSETSKVLAHAKIPVLVWR
jgi:nucleotide-binding universal stress UspA family protein